LYFENELVYLLVFNPVLLF
jgi:hypothetical protein